MGDVISYGKCSQSSLIFLFIFFFLSSSHLAFTFISPGRYENSKFVCLEAKVQDYKVKMEKTTRTNKSLINWQMTTNDEQNEYLTNTYNRFEFMCVFKITY